MRQLYFFTLFLLFNFKLIAQTPEKISFQAVIRDNGNALFANKKVNMRMIIHKGSTNGKIIYEESHLTTTNVNGLVTLEIGTGNSPLGDFKTIDWSQGPYFIETQADLTGGKNYAITGVSELLSVPYALHAKSAEAFVGTIQEDQIEDLDHFSDMDINGQEAAFSGWDKSASDDFSGDYNDLSNLPSLYTTAQVDSIMASGGNAGKTQSLSLQGNELEISEGNSVSFTNWDMDSADDFSGSYDDLINKPNLFSGEFADLENKPSFYTTVQVDSLIANNSSETPVLQSLSLEGNQLDISEGNSVSFTNWDTDSTDDFSGSYDDLRDKPFKYLTTAIYDSIKYTSNKYKLTKNDAGVLFVNRSTTNDTLIIPNGLEYSNRRIRFEAHDVGNIVLINDNINLYDLNHHEINKVELRNGHIRQIAKNEWLLIKNTTESNTNQIKYTTNQYELKNSDEDVLFINQSATTDTIIIPTNLKNIVKAIKFESHKEGSIVLNGENLNLYDVNHNKIEKPSFRSGYIRQVSPDEWILIKNQNPRRIKYTTNNYTLKYNDLGALFINKSSENDTLVLPKEITFSAKEVFLEAQGEGNIILNNGKLDLYDINYNRINNPSIRSGHLRQISSEKWILVEDGVSIISQQTHVIDVKTDLVTLVGAENNATGDGNTDDTKALQYGMEAGVKYKKTIYLPAGNYKIKSTINIHSSGLHIMGAGMDKTFITFDASYSGTEPLFKANGKNDITIEDLTITGNEKQVEAAIQVNSYPSNNSRFRFERVRIHDFFGHGIMLGSGNDPHLYSNDEIVIKDCIFYNIGDPNNLVITEPGGTGIDMNNTSFRAINLNENIRKTIITNNFIYNCSGDGIFSYGWGSQSEAYPPEDLGDWIITGNNISRCWMGIEINGNGLPRKVMIQNNIIKYPTRDYGFCLSIDAQYGQISNNTLITTDRSALEGTINQGSITNNIIHIGAYNGEEGLPATRTEGSDQANAMELYGFAVKISGNNITLNTSSSISDHTPAKFSGILLVGTTTDPDFQPTSYDGLTDYAGYFDITNNTIHGFTERAIQATNDYIRKVNISGNIFRSRHASKSVIWLHGYDWVIKDNIFDMTESRPNYGEGIIKVHNQSGKTKSIVLDNTIINDAWQFLNTEQYVAYKNDFVMNNGLSYSNYPYPPMTSSQKNSISTPKEGMAIYQTDGTKGIYHYNGTSWVFQ